MQNHQVHTYHWAPSDRLENIRNEPIKPWEILEVGDIIACLTEGIWILLSPNRLEMNNSRTSPSFPLEPLLCQNWNRFLEQTRGFFKNRYFLEFTTPILVECPGTEPSLDVFSTDLILGRTRTKKYLRTSPELHLKKALAQGFEQIFEIAPCFRNNEKTNIHNPEFYMLEWYRAYAGPEAIQQDVLSLIQGLANAFHKKGPTAAKRVTVRELFLRHTDILFEPNTGPEELRRFIINRGSPPRNLELYSLDDLFHFVFVSEIEPHLKSEDLVFVEDFPPYQSALARLKDSGWADRFEVYWHGYEIGNAFRELNDPQEQKKRAIQDLEKKQRLSKPPIPLDEEFFAFLNGGMPPSSGIAIGLDRLFLVLGLGSRFI